MSKALGVLVLVDLSRELSESEINEYLQTPEWKAEKRLVQELKRLHHEVSLHGVCDQLESVLSLIRNKKPDLIFNLTEAFGGDRQYEPHLASLFELMGLKYTGSGPEALQLCKDKALSKKILEYEGLNVPQFEFFRFELGVPSKIQNLEYPVVVKPSSFEGSEGISNSSFCKSEAEALDRIQYLFNKFSTDVIVEQYIEGRELYVAIMGNEKLEVFPPQELVFSKDHSGGPKLATYSVKWNEAYRKKWGISGKSPQDLSSKIEKQIENACKKAFVALKMRGYARMDLRLTPSQQIYFIEANPNPSIDPQDEFALAAKEAGISYSRLLEKLIHLALQIELKKN